MKKRPWLALVLIIIAITAVSRFQHTHNWTVATCQKPETCGTCGKTRGEIGKHRWIEATCEEARHCTFCLITDGEPLDHDWQEATCFYPKYCANCDATEGAPAPHVWEAATCLVPKHCTFCNAEEGALGDHLWEPATCLAAKTCTVCGTSEGEPLAHNWSEGNEITPRECFDCGTLEPLPLPESGKVFTGANLYAGSSLTIHSSSSSSCFIKLKDEAGTDIFSFFVRAGDSVTVPVPGGYYYVYFAYGDDWYGPEHVFGSRTSYSKNDEISDFWSYTWEYTLSPVVGGNFDDTPVDAEEFN